MRGLKIGLGVVKGGGLSAAFSVSIGAGPFTTGTLLTATVNGLEGGEVVTYQWTDDGVNITGATASTYTAAIGTDGIADASAIRCVVTVDGGDPINSGTRQIRYAAGTAPAVADGQSWTVDDTSVNLDGSASGANLTFSYALSGSTAGVTINSGTGAITGTPTGVGSGTATITATDQYGRELTDTFTWTSALRTQATGGADLDLAFVEDSAITSTDLKANWTTNGNTLTYAITGTALPTGLSVSSAGIMTGTPTDITADATYTLRGTDEYGRTTDDTFTLEITAVPSVTLTITTDNLDQDPPAIILDASEAGTVTWDFDASGVTAPAKGAGSIATGSYAVTAGANSDTIDLSAYVGETGYLWFRLTVGAQDSTPVVAQEITVQTANLVTDGELNNPAAWTTSEGVVSGGEFNSTGTTPQLTQSIPELVAGNSYVVSFDAVMSASAGTTYIRLGDFTSQGNEPIGTILERVEKTVVCGSTNTNLTILMGNAGGNVLTIDNVSCVPA